MQAQGLGVSSRQYNGMMDVFAQTWQHEGIRGLYKVYRPTLPRAADVLSHWLMTAIVSTFSQAIAFTSLGFLAASLWEASVFWKSPPPPSLQRFVVASKHALRPCKTADTCMSPRTLLMSNPSASNLQLGKWLVYLKWV